ncbi:MAG: ABC transporter ATP-binding protein [Helicobacter sp.]|uniref:cell division ATP-binding protein FtsE n=1 Tax=Helicobacter sp. 10-6591 TaxID=2004998 RepID=UPI000DCF5266|nr:ABC transporter ATP-binding protein [Helicobacter sp. 10-6591]MCI6217791.1 ABC transporter ATP-binding protein [Helicobacter sp.]MCI7485663.1 ABC transporter ATP-binding protein [Helicobacter sp.]MDD7567762.1 ABC transporter ATP-binding protein [Helicobacter sp.]MDY5740892.1 ABC transporter ATP-binding protein [Helicobacter sp.]RAX54595.1 ABC transporter ATP-binding protein [Helicobacter sp. 10-6591]
MSTIIEAKNLNLGYKNDENIIKDASFSINAREFVFITGASGSGKSTILSSLYGYLPIRSGGLEVYGVNMLRASKAKIHYLRQNIGIVFQDYKLVKEWNIEKNVMLPMVINGYKKEICKSQVERLLVHIKLSHKASKFPLELSGGEQQRVAMARALAHNPAIILADEPTGNLDDYSSELIWGLLKGVNEQLGITVVVVTHRLPERLSINYRRLHIEEGVVYEFS